VIRRSTLEALAALILLVSTAAAAHAFGCTVSTTPINFGGYDTLSHNGASAVATITYSCPEKTQRVAIGLTKGYAGTFAMREMRTGSHKLAYNLYLDASGTQIWGDGTGEGQLYVAPAPPPGSKVTIMIFGRIQPGQNATAGNYADDVQVILKN
jgi:spore coat protein U domain-containing protein, fimbrial subunit CupE1/2/3/6